MSSIPSFLQATRELSTALNRIRFPSPVKFVYNPLEYAWAVHEQYLQRYLKRRQKVLFLGMNPGPFGMAQTGVPFGEVAAVRDWLGLSGTIATPGAQHPRKPIQGFECPRSEVSGRRLWGLFAERFGSPRAFFKNHFVYNYCPLVFIDGGTTGRNLTPENLRGPAFKKVETLCNRHLERLLECCGAEFAVGVGNFAAQRLQQVVRDGEIVVGKVLHPSPASPAANRDWAGAATRALEGLGAWQARGSLGHCAPA